MASAMWPAPIIDPREWGYSGIHWELYRCCLLRTLMSYKGVPASEGGSAAVEDLASAFPEVSADGLTWTFRLRKGLHYAPPLADVEIVAADVVRALERLGSPEMPTGSYSSYFSVVVGFDEFHGGEAETIVGLETPDDHTLVMRLVEPTGDLPYRLSLPATAPLPEGVAEGHDAEYFRFLVASGPYMIEGSDELDFSVAPNEQQPLTGFVPRQSLTLVRNPSWEPATDPLRPAYVDRIEIALWPMAKLGAPEITQELASRTDAGTLDLANWTADAEQFRRYLADPALRDRVIVVQKNVVDYMPLNLAMPPFDDVHVRRAVNLVIDKAAIADRFNRAIGEDEVARVISHIIPSGLEGGLLPDDWRPAWSRGVGDGGDVVAARAEMALSRYDHDGDGVCDDHACLMVPALVDTKGYAFDYSWWWDQVRTDLQSIGIRLKPTVAPCLSALSKLNPASHVGIAMSVCAGWQTDFPNASGFIPLLDGSGLHGTESQNTSLLGATTSQLDLWGYDVRAVPSIDRRIDACMALVGARHTECWARLDQYVSEEVVPWVTLLTWSRRFVVSGRVAHVTFNEQSGRPSFDRIALTPGSD